MKIPVVGGVPRAGGAGRVRVRRTIRLRWKDWSLYSVRGGDRNTAQDWRKEQ